VLAALLWSAQARAFSQFGGVTPVGHEWLTSRAALEVLGDAHVGQGDPRQSAPLSQARARDLTISDGMRRAVRGSGYRSRSDLPLDTPYNAIYSAVVGVRWVDMAGTSVAVESARSQGTRVGMVPNCFNAVAQNPSELQHDHFLRARGETGGSGALAAIQASVRAFRSYFIAAATAATGNIHVVDGGAAESASLLVERPAFLLGRAAHLLQDSFSTEHGIRRASEGFAKVHGIKTFVCSRDSYRHTAHYPVSSSDRYHDGDVIWRSGPPLTPHVAQVDAATLRPWALARSSCERGGAGCDAQLKIPYDWTWRSGHGTAVQPPEGFLGVSFRQRARQ
jgi:hypothetical protein